MITLDIQAIKLSRMPRWFLAAIDQVHAGKTPKDIQVNEQFRLEVHFASNARRNSVVATFRDLVRNLGFPNVRVSLLETDQIVCWDFVDKAGNRYEIWDTNTTGNIEAVTEWNFSGDIIEFNLRYFGHQK